jgi:hypothetical protein
VLRELLGLLVMGYLLLPFLVALNALTFGFLGYFLWPEASAAIGAVVLAVSYAGAVLLARYFHLLCLERHQTGTPSGPPPPAE